MSQIISTCKDAEQELAMVSQMTGDNELLGTGPPTREELDEFYPAKFSWEQLKLFVNSGYGR